MSKPVLIYVAGPLSNGGKASPLEYLRNVSTMQEVGRHIEGRWASPKRTFFAFLPCNDMLEALSNPDTCEATLKAKSVAIMLRCDAVYRIMGESPGVEEEVRAAKDAGVPVVETVGQLRKLFGQDDYVPLIE